MATVSILCNICQEPCGTFCEFKGGRDANMIICNPCFTENNIKCKGCSQIIGMRFEEDITKSYCNKCKENSSIKCTDCGKFLGVLFEETSPVKIQCGQCAANRKKIALDREKNFFQLLEEQRKNITFIGDERKRIAEEEERKRIAEEEEIEKEKLEKLARLDKRLEEFAAQNLIKKTSEQEIIMRKLLEENNKKELLRRNTEKILTENDVEKNNEEKKKRSTKLPFLRRLSSLNKQQQ